MKGGVCYRGHCARPEHKVLLEESGMDLLLYLPLSTPAHDFIACQLKVSLLLKEQKKKNKPEKKFKHLQLIAVDKTKAVWLSSIN